MEANGGIWKRLFQGDSSGFLRDRVRDAVFALCFLATFLVRRGLVAISLAFQR
jgi:hypothetical protein